MKLLGLLRAIVCFILLSQCLTFSARPHPSGSGGLHEHDQQQTERQKQAPGWWSEDYSLPRRRRPVHNKLDP